MWIAIHGLSNNTNIKTRKCILYNYTLSYFILANARYYILLNQHYEEGKNSNVKKLRQTMHTL